MYHCSICLKYLACLPCHHFTSKTIQVTIKCEYISWKPEYEIFIWKKKKEKSHFNVWTQKQKKWKSECTAAQKDHRFSWISWRTFLAHSYPFWRLRQQCMHASQHKHNNLNMWYNYQPKIKYLLSTMQFDQNPREHAPSCLNDHYNNNSVHA